MIIHALEHTLEDSWLLLIFLFGTYAAMEYLEHRMGDGTRAALRRAGSVGPLIGAALGVVPQCGFSAAASNLYAGRVITLGTLLAVYLSTSDEMLPVMISAQAPIGTILGILGVKLAVGVAAGFAADAVCCLRSHAGGKTQANEIHALCEHEHCDCERGGILRSALKHTVQVGIFVVLITFALNLALEFAGEDALAGVLLDEPILGPVIAGVVGFIPNCAASVVITELYLNGVIGVGTMLAGLLVGAGVGLLVLFRVNPHRAENLRIAGALYGVGVAVGIAAELIV